MVAGADFPMDGRDVRTIQPGNAGDLLLSAWQAVDADEPAGLRDARSRRWRDTLRTASAMEDWFELIVILSPSFVILLHDKR